MDAQDESAGSAVYPWSDATKSGDIAALEAEIEALRSQLEGDAPARTGSGLRRFIAWVLAILAIILVSLAVTVGWAETVLLDMDTFVSTLSPLAENEAVAEALSVQIGDAVVEATALEDSISEALPAELRFIAGPVATATGDLVATVANNLISTETFAAVWNTTLRAVHRSLSVLLTGSGAVVADEGTVAIDLDTVAEPIIAAVTEKGLDIRALVGEDFTLGQIVLVESDALGSAQAAVRILDTLGWLTVIVAIVAIAAAILVAADRRRQIAILGFGTALAGLVNLVSLRFGRGLAVGGIRDEVNRSAGLAVWNALVRNLTGSIWVLIFVAFVVGFAAWVAGPGPRAGSVRMAAGNGIHRRRGGSQEPPAGLSLFFYTWRRALEWTAVGVGLLVLLIMPTVSFAIAVLVVLVGAAVVATIELMAGPQANAHSVPAGNESESVNAS